MHEAFYAIAVHYFIAGKAGGGEGCHEYNKGCRSGVRGWSERFIPRRCRLQSYYWLMLQAIDEKQMSERLINVLSGSENMGLSGCGTGCWRKVKGAKHNDKATSVALTLNRCHCGNTWLATIK